MTTPQHTDQITLTLDGEDTAVLLDILRVFDPADTCLEAHGFTVEAAWAVIAKVALAAIDDGLYVVLTREEVAVLHCVVSSAEVPALEQWDHFQEDYLRVEAELSNLKMTGGYTPRYMESEAVRLRKW